MEPSPDPAITAAKACPRCRSNHALTTRAYASWVVPFPTIPRITKTAYRCHNRGVSSERDANEAAYTIVQGSTTRRAGKRSSRYPRNGEQIATVSAASVKARDICVREQWSAEATGFRNIPNV